MGLKVKDTYLSRLHKCDILMYMYAGIIPNLDVLGAIIVAGSGNEGRDRDQDGKPDIGPGKGIYTHCAWLRDLPDPEAEVEEVRPGIFKVKDHAIWTEQVKRPAHYQDSWKIDEYKRSKAGIRVHATFPQVCEETADYDNAQMEVWRIRNLTPEVAEGITKLINDMVGYNYNIAEFVTFGLVRQAHAKICSQFIGEPAYYASMLLDKQPITLTPDISGIRGDQIITPNDIINSGSVFRPTYQGLLP